MNKTFLKSILKEEIGTNITQGVKTADDRTKSGATDKRKGKRTLKFMRRKKAPGTPKNREPSIGGNYCPMPKVSTGIPVGY